MAIKRQKIVADFETTTTPDDVRVWAVCGVDIETSQTVFLDTSIDRFMDWLSTRNTACYFHNLKFDGEFILHWLLSHGYKHNDSNEAGTFSTLITDEGVFYSITVIFERLNKQYKKVTFFDSLKKLPFKVATISKAFELEDEKLVIDYYAYRPPDHILTEDEKRYIVNDCRIVAQALKIQFEKGLNKMTNASDAMNGYKEIITKKNFERWFPVFPVEMDNELRRAYKGGYVYLNPKHKDKRGLKGITLDVNSLYPSRMYNCVLPFGYPVYFEGEPEPDEDYPLYIAKIRCAFEIKPDHLPTIQLKNNRAYVETEYLTSSRNNLGVLEIVEMTLTNVDLELMKDHYNLLNYEVICGWKFKGAKNMFKEYIDFWMHIKETSTGAIKQLAKLQLNSLYGRFAMNPKAYQKACFLDRDGVVRYEVVKDRQTAKKYGVSPPELRDPVYTAMGCFITAYARDYTIRSAQNNFDRFIYADTDSLHLIGFDIPEDLEIHPTKLGAWCHEGSFVDSKYIRSKTYMETMEETKSKADLKTYSKILTKTFDVWREPEQIRYYETKVTCAGMPDNVKESVTYDNFCSGSTFEGKLMPRRYKGGIILEDTTFTIK